MTDRPSSRRIPSYRKHRPSGQAVVTLNGKDYYLGKFGTAASREKYARMIAEWTERGQQATRTFQIGLSPTMTVNEVILGYLQHCLDYYRDSQKEREKIRLALRPLRSLYGRSQAVVFGPLALKAVRGEMCKTLARRTVNQRIDIIRRMFRWAVGNEMVLPSVYEALRAVEGLRKGRSSARETEPVRPVPDQLVEKTLPWVNGHIRGMILFQRLTGARSSEVCLIRPRDVDRSGQVWVYRPYRHKTAYRGQERVIYIGPKAQQVLAPFLDVGPEEYVFSPRRMMEERYGAMRLRRKSKVPPSQLSRKKSGARKRPGKRYDAKSYYHAVRRACKRAGIERWFPHQLRHSSATELRKQVGIEVARIILGQRHVSTTELYAHLDGEKAREVMAQLG